MKPHVLAVAVSAQHAFSKAPAAEITLVTGLGVAGDVHSGETVKHRSRVKRDPSQPNLRQVHLIHAELFDRLDARGFKVAPGELGENITTRDLDLLSLAENTVLRIGGAVALRITGLRNPCHQIDDFQKGLMAATLDKLADGTLIRKAGVMAVVVHGGVVKPGDAIAIDPPAGDRRPLSCV